MDSKDYNRYLELEKVMKVDGYKYISGMMEDNSLFDEYMKLREDREKDLKEARAVLKDAQESRTDKLKMHKCKNGDWEYDYIEDKIELKTSTKNNYKKTKFYDNK